MSYLTEWKDLILARDPAAWIDRYIQKNELNQPFALYPHQCEIVRLMFDFDAEGILSWDTLVWSCVKKSGKTSLLAILSLWWAMTQEPPNEVILVANDMEQTLSRAYASVVRLLKYNRIDPGAIVTQKEIKLSNETTIRAIASEYAGASGSNHGLVGLDELWAYTSERSQRLFEELTSVPTRRNSIKLIVTYAGFESESKLLREIYLQSVDREEHPEGQGERLHVTLPIYANRESRICCYWDHEQGRFPWQTERYYRSQQRTLRAAQYLRFHENRWSASSEMFINPALWDACTDEDHRPLLPAKDIPLFVGVDASLKHDSSAVVSVGFVERDGHEYIALAQHRIWHPSPDDPIDLEEDIERYLLELCGQYRVWRVYCDPWQMQNTVQRLSKKGIRIEAYPQTVPNLTRSGQALFDLLNGRTLLLYRASDLRQQALQTVAVESARG